MYYGGTLSMIKYQKGKRKCIYFSFLLLSFCFISGKQTCYSGWKTEYTGFHMTEYKNYSNTDYACMDKDAEPIDSDTSDNKGALFYPVRTTCGSLRCPP
jgi:hypothetical protein